MDVSALNLNNIPCYVSEERLKKSSGYFKQRDKKLCIGVDILLNYVLEKIGIKNPLFDTNRYGKPYLKNYSYIQFNLAHSENYVICAVSDTPVGVDMECIHDIDLDVAKNYFNSVEYEYILNSNNINAFFELWVLIESYMKMTGLGFSMDPKEISIKIDNEIRLTNAQDNCKLGLWNVCDGNYMIGLCSKKSAIKPVLINLEDIVDKNKKKEFGLS